MITSPNIARVNYNIIGWNTVASAEASAWNSNISGLINSNYVWYAIIKLKELYLRDVILSHNILKTGANFSVFASTSNSSTQQGLFSIEDQFGISYYFRGTHIGLNNNLIFANYQWKILRIQGNGNIKLVYNGVCPNNTCNINGRTAGTLAQSSTSVFNSVLSDNRYVGFMYGNTCTSYAECHANERDSTIKQVLTSWYANNIINQGAAITERLTNGDFCNDRSLSSGSGTGAEKTTYARGANVITPRLLCTREEDRLSLQVGLLSADEIVLSGGGALKSETPEYYLYSGSAYYTMTPSNFDGSSSSMRYVYTDGNLHHNYQSYGVRPVITLRFDVIVKSGDGSIETPYKIL